MISVCMPFFNRMGLLRDTLEDFEERGYLDLDLEISICDDGSQDSPLDELTLKCFPFKYVLSRLPKKTHWQNPCVPLNKAIHQSHGDIILLQGPETRHPMPILPRMLEVLGRRGGSKHIVLCPTKEGDPAKTRMNWRSHPVHLPQHLWFCQLMYREFFDEVGGVDERFREGHGGWDDNSLEARLTNEEAVWSWLDPVKYFAVHVHTGSKRHKRGYEHQSNKRLYAELYPDNPTVGAKSNAP